jgi:hypothetical protein
MRELQNIVERSVICGGDTFSIGEAWLSSHRWPDGQVLSPTLQDGRRR